MKTGAAAYALVLVKLPDLLLAVNRDSSGRAFLGAERTVHALARVADGQPVVARLHGRGLRLRSAGVRRRGGWLLGRGLFLEVGALDHEFALVARYHVVVRRELDGVLDAEIGAVGAEGAAAEEEAAGNELALLRVHGCGADGASGANALAHAAGDAPVRVEHYAPAVALRGRRVNGRILLRARL